MYIFFSKFIDMYVYAQYQAMSYVSQIFNPNYTNVGRRIGGGVGGVVQVDRGDGADRGGSRLTKKPELNPDATF